MAIQNNPKAKKLIDAYIAKQKKFGSVLIALRKIIHRADPEVIEDWKWGPSFFHEGIMVNIGAFSGWATIVFFKGTSMKDPKKLFNFGMDNANSRRINFTELSQVTKIEKDLVAYIHEAIKLNEAGVKIGKTRRLAKPMPAEVKKALMRQGVMKSYAARPPFQQRDYVSWISAAKQEETRSKRLNQMLEELEDGDRYMGMAYKLKK